MLEDIAEAIACHDYQRARELLERTEQNNPNHPWIPFYRGRLQEAAAQFEAAETTYRHLLSFSDNLKLISRTREALTRVIASNQERFQRERETAIAQPGGQQPGVFILEPLNSDRKLEAAQHLSRIFQLDVYHARTQIPSRGWRLFRTGAIAELQFNTNALKEVGIPCFSVALSAVEGLNVFGVQFFLGETPQVSLRCRHMSKQEGILNFTWSEVARRVEGKLPLFDAVVKVDRHLRIERRAQTLDYVEFCDLHLPERHLILRLSDRSFNFQQESAVQFPGETARERWQQLLSWLDDRLPQTPIWSEFEPFGKTALPFAETLRSLRPHIHLQRREESLWDAAFELYSALVFLK